MLKQHPYHLLLFAGLLLVAMSLLPGANRTVDIHLHDTYFVIARSHFYLVFAFLLWVVWALCFFARPWLFSNTLTWLHVGLTLLTVLLLLWLLHFGNRFQPKRYLDVSSWRSFSAFELHSRLIAYSLFSFLLAQFIFVVHLITGLIKRKQQSA